MSVFVPEFYTRNELNLTEPKDGDLLIYDPQNGEFRINQNGWRLQYQNEKNHWADTWTTRTGKTRRGFVDEAISISRRFGMYLEQTSPRRDGEPTFVLRKEYATLV